MSTIPGIKLNTSLKQDSPNLDILRATAILVVLVSHLPSSVGLGDDPFWGLESIGRMGVRMFFIHTSLVLMMSLRRLELQGGSLIGRFYVRRLFRIYPLSLFVVLFIYFLHIPRWFRLPLEPYGPMRLWSNLLLTMNITDSLPAVGPLWSLPYEVQMYLFLPFIYFAAKRIRNPLAILGGGFFIWFVDNQIYKRTGFPDLLAYAPWFFMGTAAYFLWGRRRFSTGYYYLSLVLLIAIPFAWWKTVGEYKAGWVEWSVGIAFSLLLAMFHETESHWLRHASHYIAKYSYGVYLTHGTILWFTVEKLAGYSLVWRLPLCVTLLVAVPVILFHTIEDLFVNAGVRLAKGLVKAPVPLKAGKAVEGVPA
jgi:peptidoglycan/LPS O-acetylase OafA/YrhL